MRLSRIWRIQGGCYPQRPKTEVDYTFRDLQNSSYPTKAEFKTFSVNSWIICSGLHFWCHWFNMTKFFPNLVNSSWLWWIMRVVLANQKREIFWIDKKIMPTVLEIRRWKVIVYWLHIRVCFVLLSSDWRKYWRGRVFREQLQIQQGDYDQRWTHLTVGHTFVLMLSWAI